MNSEDFKDYLNSINDFREKEIRNGLNSRLFLYNIGVLTKAGKVRSAYRYLFEENPTKNTSSVK
jgi:hypothetical protein